jgi:hypothetical protein
MDRTIHHLPEKPMQSTSSKPFQASSEVSPTFQSADATTAQRATPSVGFRTVALALLVDRALSA